MRLEKIQERLARATEAPWVVHDFSPLDGSVTVSCDHPATITVAHMGPALTGGLSEKQANAAFIAHAITDIPYLLARLAETEKMLAESRRERASADIHFSDAIGLNVQRAEAAESTVATLTERVKGLEKALRDLLHGCEALNWECAILPNQMQRAREALTPTPPGAPDGK